MVQYDKVVLNKLLDSYESSLLSTGKNERTIHIEFKFMKKYIPAYFDESSGDYERIHMFMQQLEDGGLIKIVWKDNKKGHIISKVQLNIEQLDTAYAYVKRISKADLVTANVELLEKILEQTDSGIIGKYANYLLECLKENTSVKEFIELDNIEETKKIFQAIEAIERNQQQLYIREFSIRTFQDSKVFEKIVKKVHRISQRFDAEHTGSELSDWLSEYNIYHTPNFVYLKGNGTIGIGNTQIELDFLEQGLGISGEDIEGIQILRTENVKKIITIENLTTYFRWKEENGLIIYLGGYHNQVRRNLLKKIHATYQEAEYYHFGDIDAGGFEIYRDLCHKTNIPFEMYHMNLETLQKYEMYGKKLTENDRKRLKELQNQEKLSKIVRYMLERDVKLEQECIELEKE